MLLYCSMHAAPVCCNMQIDHFAYLHRMITCTAQDGLSCSTCSASNGIHVTVHSILHPFSPKHVCLLLTSAVTVIQLGMIQEAGVCLKQ